EEQFYLLWPALVSGVALLSQIGSQTRRHLLWMTLAFFAASITWAIYATSASPASAYFSTLTRSFQFALGGALAVVAPSLVQMPRKMRLWLNISGISLIFGSIWLIVPERWFPGPMGLLPTIGAALFIAAGTGTDENVSIWPL